MNQVVLQTSGLLFTLAPSSTLCQVSFYMLALQLNLSITDALGSTWCILGVPVVKVVFVPFYIAGTIDRAIV